MVATVKVGDVIYRITKDENGRIVAKGAKGKKLGHSPAAFLCTRYPGKCTVRFHLPGKPNQSATAAVEDAPKDLVLQGTLH